MTNDIDNTPPLSGNAPLPQPCPECGHRTLGLRWALTARPPGTYSIAGVQTKIVATPRAAVTCATAGCPFHVDGTIEGATVDASGLTFTGGHFVSDDPPSAADAA